jgi:hypothetical protein
MPPIRLPYFVLLALAFTPLAAQPVLQPGEALNYSVGWGLFSNAGEIKIFTENSILESAPSHLLTVTTTATRGLARALFAFDARAEALVDARSGQLRSHLETSTTSKKNTRNVTTFDYATRTAFYRDEFNPAKNLDFALPAGEPLDLILCLINTRTWDLKPGQHRDALVLFQEEAYELTIHAVRYESITTPLGTFNTLVLEPRMEKTPPKGMFKRGTAVRVWIAQNDPRRLPVRFEVEFKFGSGVATLNSYQAPSAPTSDAPHISP